MTCGNIPSKVKFFWRESDRPIRLPTVTISIILTVVTVNECDDLNEKCGNLLLTLCNWVARGAVETLPASQHRQLVPPEPTSAFNILINLIQDLTACFNSHIYAYMIFVIFSPRTTFWPYVVSTQKVQKLRQNRSRNKQHELQ